MSELKAFNMPRYAGAFTTHEVYLKSEADHYISELIADQQLELDDWYCKVQYHKYKRCLAMANYCYTNVHCIMGHRLCALSDWKKEWFERWRKRWLELAEKFKEAK